MREQHCSSDPLNVVFDGIVFPDLSYVKWSKWDTNDDSRLPGVVVRCHEHRLQQHNRRDARKLLVSAVDDFINGEMSVRNQKLRIEKDRKIRADQKARKMREKKRLAKEEEECREREQDEEEGIVDAWTKRERARTGSDNS